MAEKGSGKLIINGQEWVPFAYRNMSFWHQWLSNLGHFHNFKDWGMGVPIRMLSITVNGTHTQVFKTPGNKKESDEAVLKLFSTKNKINLLEKRYKKFSAELLKSLVECHNSLTLRNWQRFEENYTRYTFGLALTATMGRIGMETLVQKIEKMGVKDSEIPKIVSTITYPGTHTPLFESVLDMLKIGTKIQTGVLEKKEIENELGKWLIQYGHIPVNFCDEAWSLSDARAQLKEALKKDCGKEIKELDKSHKEKVLAASEKIKQLKNKEIALLAFALQRTAYLNEFRKNVFCFVSLNIRPLFAKIAKMANSGQWQDCYYLLPREIADILSGKIKSIENIVKSRKIVACYMDDNNARALFLDKQSTKKVFDFISLKGSSVKTEMVGQQEIKGFSASPGKVKGIAKVILSSKDFSKLLPGEILVTIMTSVDFVPIMEKASAFVTDEGGITSHAAIVAREMNKPCIIGTKIATKVLKDGDLVEVDAERGVVRVIK